MSPSGIPMYYPCIGKIAACLRYIKFFTPGKPKGVYTRESSVLVSSTFVLVVFRLAQL